MGGVGLAEVAGFGVGVEVRSGLKVSEVESLQAEVVLPEPRMGGPGHAQQAFAAELLPPVF